MDKLLLVMVFLMAGASVGVSVLRSVIPPDETGFAAAVVYYSAPLAAMIPIILFVFMLKKSDSKNDEAILADTQPRTPMLGEDCNAM